MKDRNLLVTLRYDGRAFHGWQVQKNAPTAMETFQQALWDVLGEQTDVKGCSRTDAGVHARAYGVSFHTGCAIPCGGLVRALNAALPPEMAARACREVPPDFHARYSARGKRYVYRILNSDLRDPFSEGWACRVAQPLDADAMHRAAQAFVGTHDFASFQNAGTDVSDTVRTIFSCAVRRSGEFITFTVEGGGFLYHMVRIMAGTLIDLQRGALQEGSLPGILAARDRTRAGFTAPACGLTLDEVFYDLPKGGDAA